MPPEFWCLVGVALLCFVVALICDAPGDGQNTRGL